jgi:hypothetical protein
MASSELRVDMMEDNREEEDAVRNMSSTYKSR